MVIFGTFGTVFSTANYFWFGKTNVLLFYSDNKEHNSNQLTVINAHVGYVLFTVVMTTFTVAPSSGVPYADAL